MTWKEGWNRPQNLLNPLRVNFSGSSFAPNVDPNCHFLRKQFTCMQEEVRTFPKAENVGFFPHPDSINIFRKRGREWHPCLPP